VNKRREEELVERRNNQENDCLLLSIPTGEAKCADLNNLLFQFMGIFTKIFGSRTWETLVF
jgi:hypothetical protein